MKLSHRMCEERQVIIGYRASVIVCLEVTVFTFICNRAERDLAMIHPCSHHLLSLLLCVCVCVCVCVCLSTSMAFLSGAPFVIQRLIMLQNIFIYPNQMFLLYSNLKMALSPAVLLLFCIMSPILPLRLIMIKTKCCLLVHVNCQKC